MRRSARLECHGACGRPRCAFVTDRRAVLRAHVDAARGQAPQRCPCGFASAYRQSLVAHVRRTHADWLAPDGSYAPLGIGPQRVRLGLPADLVGSVTPAQWAFVKALVTACVRSDRRRFPKHARTRALVASNEARHALAHTVVGVVVARRLLRDGADDFGGCGPLVLRPYCVFRLSLNRVDRARPHFDPDLENVAFVPSGLANTSNPFGVLGPRLLRWPDGAPTKVGAAAIRVCCVSVWARRERSCRGWFGTCHRFIQHATRLWERQRGRCEVSLIRMRRPTRKYDPLAPSLDAIDPTKGHVVGNLRWVCMCFNSVNRVRDRRYEAAEDRWYPTAWTRRLWLRYVGRTAP